MNENLIEHVARALCKADHLDPDEDPNYVDGKMYTDVAHSPGARLWGRYRVKAKVAIEAMQSYKHSETPKDSQFQMPEARAQNNPSSKT